MRRFNHQFPSRVLCPILCCAKIKKKERKKKNEEKIPARSFHSLNSEHLARGPAVLMSWKSTEHVHRERQDFRRGWVIVNKTGGMFPSSPACGTSAMSPRTVGGKLAVVSVCSPLGATERSVACHKAQWIHGRCRLNINNRGERRLQPLISFSHSCLPSSLNKVRRGLSGIDLWAKLCWFSCRFVFSPSAGHVIDQRVKGTRQTSALTHKTLETSHWSKKQQRRDGLLHIAVSFWGAGFASGKWCYCWC